MPWTYSQSTGILRHGDVVISGGYSGHGEGKNNPTKQTVANVGPIPRGTWTIGEPFHDTHTGPYSMRLTPTPGTNTFGRTAFLIHGDSIAHPGEASDGCIILNPIYRQQIWNSRDHVLQVVQ